MKKRIALDLDGVCANFIGAFLERYNSEYQTSFTKQDIKEFNLAKALKEPDEQTFGMIYQMQMDEKTYQDLPMIKGANYYTNKLVGEGHKIYVVSNRPNASDTVHWLLRTGVAYSGIYLTKDKLKVMETKGLDTIVEDRAKTAMTCSKAGKKTVILDQPWNQHAEGDNITRCYNWQDIYENLK